MEGIDVRTEAREVVKVLHKNKIPIDLAQSVFDEPMFLINHIRFPIILANWKQVKTSRKSAT